MWAGPHHIVINMLTSFSCCTGEANPFLGHLNNSNCFVSFFHFQHCFLISVHLGRPEVRTACWLCLLQQWLGWWWRRGWGRRRGWGGVWIKKLVCWRGGRGVRAWGHRRVVTEEICIHIFDIFECKHLPKYIFVYLREGCPSMRSSTSSHWGCGK